VDACDLSIDGRSDALSLGGLVLQLWWNILGR
jgi:hypothetical protein